MPALATTCSCKSEAETGLQITKSNMKNNCNNMKNNGNDHQIPYTIHFEALDHIASALETPAKAINPITAVPPIATNSLWTRFGLPWMVSDDDFTGSSLRMMG